MITRLSMGAGEEVQESPEPQRESLMGKRARVTSGARAGEVVEVVAEANGQTTAVWTDEAGTKHRFRAASNIFSPVATRRRTKRARKKKGD